jgi:gliding motility-associated-like protein
MNISHIMMGTRGRLQDRQQYQDYINRVLIQKAAQLPYKSIGPLNKAKTLGSLSLTVSQIGTTCGYSNGQFTALATGGTAPYTYSENGYPFQSSAVFTQKAPGTYTVMVMDATGQTATATIVLTNTYSPPTIGMVGYSNPSPCTGMDGTVTLYGLGGTPPYTFSDDLINFQSSPIFTNLSATHDFFEFFIRDANGCTYPYDEFFYGYNCPIWGMVAYTNNTCKNDGWITFEMPHGGIAPYSYSLDGIHYQTTTSFNNLTAGLYHIYTKDATGAIAISAIQLFEYCNLNLTIQETDAGCNKNDGVIVANVSNGVAPYLYSLDGINYQASNTFTGLMPGLYTVFVIDANSTSGSYNNITVNTYCPPLSVSVVAATCGSNNGAITATANYGTAPFQYSIDGVYFQTSNVFNGLAPGNYTVTAKDAAGVISTSNSILVSNGCPLISLVETDAICTQNNGSITASGINGTPPYEYSLDGSNFQNSPIFNGLPAGNYTITIKDFNGFTNQSFIIVNDVCVQVNASATSSTCSKANGSILAIGSMGTLPYLYSIDGINFQSNPQFNNLIAGNYIIYIKDFNNLTNNTAFTITDIPGPQLSLTKSKVTCLDNDGSITASVNSGTAPFQYSINGAAFQPSPKFVGLDSSTKTVSVMDANGCTDLTSASLPLLNTLNLNAGSDPTICEGSSTILSPISNGDSYYWTPASNLANYQSQTTTANPNISTKYYIHAALGICQKIDSLVVIVNPAPIANAGKDTSICFGKSVQLLGSGGTSFNWTPTIYLDNPAVFNPQVTNPVNTTTYHLSVKVLNGCQSLKDASITVQVEPPPKLFAGNDTSILIGQSLQLYAIDLNNAGFIKYNWSPAAGLSNTGIQNPIASIQEDISYSVKAITADGCTGISNITIKAFAVADIFVPNAFTPNSDGHNDKLRAIPIGIKDFKYFEVYNRWGQRVFYTSNANLGWDGTVGGAQQSTGSFVWVTKGIDFHGNIIQKKGIAILIR